MNTIQKQWYVIYDGKNIVDSGNSTGKTIFPGVAYAEFDTEAEMLQFITDNELITPEETTQ